MRTRPFLPFKIALGIFLAWCTLPVLGFGLDTVQDGQSAFAHWFLGVAEFIGGASVLTFVLGAHSAWRTDPTVGPTETEVELAMDRAREAATAESAHAGPHEQLPAR